MDESRIRQRAYEIWERAGRPEGRHGEHWAQAAQELAAEPEGGAASEALDATAANTYSGQGDGNLGDAAKAMRGIDVENPTGPARAPEHTPGAEEESGGGA
jgi:hypothetical protein